MFQCDWCVSKLLKPSNGALHIRVGLIISTAFSTAITGDTLSPVITLLIILHLVSRPDAAVTLIKLYPHFVPSFTPSLSVETEMFS